MKICKVENCNEKSHIREMCKKHYRQWYRYGKTKEKTLFDKNEIIINGRIAEIILCDKQSLEKGRTKINIEDISKVIDKKWHLSTDGYAIASDRTRLAHLILGVNNCIVDHIDRNKLNNTRNNLRVCDCTTNNRNRGVHKRNKIGVLGVSKTINNTYKSHIRVGNKSIHLGTYKTLEEAKKARKQGEIKYW